MVRLKIISYILEIYTKIFLEKVTGLGMGEAGTGRGTDKTKLAISYNY